jgi:hypothetical protein
MLTTRWEETLNDKVTPKARCISASIRNTSVGLTVKVGQLFPAIIGHRYAIYSVSYSVFEAAVGNWGGCWLSNETTALIDVQYDFERFANVSGSYQSVCYVTPIPFVWPTNTAVYFAQFGKINCLSTAMVSALLLPEFFDSPAPPSLLF